MPARIHQRWSLYLKGVASRAREIAPGAAVRRPIGLHRVIIADDYGRFQAPKGEATLPTYAAAKPSGGVRLHVKADNLCADYICLLAARVAYDALPVDQSWSCAKPGCVTQPAIGSAAALRVDVV